MGGEPGAGYTAQLAAEEMGTNSLKYGFDDAGEHQIGLRTVCDPDACRIELSDDGHASLHEPEAVDGRR